MKYFSSTLPAGLYLGLYFNDLTMKDKDDVDVLCPTDSSLK